MLFPSALSSPAWLHHRPRPCPEQLDCARIYDNAQDVNIRATGTGYEALLRFVNKYARVEKTRSDFFEHARLVFELKWFLSQQQYSGKTDDARSHGIVEVVGGIPVLVVRPLELFQEFLAQTFLFVLARLLCPRTPVVVSVIRSAACRVFLHAHKIVVRVTQLALEELSMITWPAVPVWYMCWMHL